MRLSSGEGWLLRWKEMRMDTLTTAMYIANRSHERNAKEQLLIRKDFVIIIRAKDIDLLLSFAQ